MSPIARRLHLFAASWLLLLLVAMGAQAQTAGVWRCGPEGRSYQQQPCAEGQALALADARSAAEQAQARQVAAREQHLLRDLQAQSRERERAAKAQGSPLLGIRSSGLGDLKPAEPGLAEPRSKPRLHAGKTAKTQKPRKQPQPQAHPARPGAAPSPATALASPHTRG